jgi:SAM-dependent methyltransferase
MSHLEIGGGTLTPNAEVNLDPVHGTDGWKFFAQDRTWPANDGTFSSARASHVMEHIPSGATRIHVMNEAHRVLAPGAEFEIIVPGAVAREPGAMLGWWAIADPTHVSLWVPESFHYFDGTFAANADYGIRLWETVELRVDSGWEIHWRGRPR